MYVGSRALYVHTHMMNYVPISKADRGQVSEHRHRTKNMLSPSQSELK